MLRHQNKDLSASVKFKHGWKSGVQLPRYQIKPPGASRIEELTGTAPGRQGHEEIPANLGCGCRSPGPTGRGWEPRRPYLLRQQRQRFSRLGCGGGGRLLELILRLRARHGLIRVSAGSALPCDNHHPAGCGSAGADGTCTGLNESREAQGGPRGRARGAAAAARSIPGGGARPGGCGP